MSRIIPDIVQGADALPSEADVVIIGGGIIGVSTAFYLAKRGIKVVLCEKGLIAGEQSSRNWGWVRQMGRDVAEIPLAIHSLKLWAGLNEELGTETGFRQTGITYLCRNGRDVAEFGSWVRPAKEHGVDIRMLDNAGLQSLLPGLGEDFVSGMYTASDGRAEPTMAASAIARGAAKLGATIMINCAVRGIERSGGAVSAVVTERGVVRTRQVVLAGGAWSRLFCQNLDIDIPILKILGSVGRVGPREGLPDMPIGASNFAFRRRLDGGYNVSMRNANIVSIVPDSFRLFADFSPQLLSSWREIKLRFGRQFFEEMAFLRKWELDAETVFEKVRILDPEPVSNWLKKGIEIAAKAFPAFRGAKLTKSWGGIIDSTPDLVPVMGPAPSLPGLFIATGFSGHGFGIGPGSGEMIAQMINGEIPHIDPHPFRLDRFKRADPKCAG